ncbi:MAG: hypothetical protein KAY46_11085 [Burkholderiaceae bacterium]|nr:hypothetical protein [Burkholderiaceae bacterium]
MRPVDPGSFRASSLLLAVSLILAACAGLPTARMEMPATLAPGEPQTLEGPIGSAQGEFRLGELHGRFQRSASRLTWFDRLAQDRATLGYTLEPDGLRADCTLQGQSAKAGVLQIPVARMTYLCAYSQRGAPLAHRLDLRAIDSALGTRAERRGRIEMDGIVLELQSVHRVQGSPLPLAAPVGYLFLHDGRPVAALDLNDVRARLWRRHSDAPDSALARAVSHAALALALLWDPATQ